MKAVSRHPARKPREIYDASWMLEAAFSAAKTRLGAVLGLSINDRVRSFTPIIASTGFGFSRARHRNANSLSSLSEISFHRRTLQRANISVDEKYENVFILAGLTV